MVKNKIITLILSAVVVIGTFAGCGNGEKSGDLNNSNEIVSEENGDSKDNQEENKDNFDWVNEILNTSNRSQSLEKYMRNPDQVKEEKFMCAIEAIDVKTEEDGTQIVYGQVIEPYQLAYSYEEYLDDNIKYVFMRYNPSEFDGTRVLANDIIAFTGLYSKIYADTIYSERKEAPMFEIEARLNFGDYANMVALDKFMSSMGQSIKNLGITHVSEDDAVFNELLSKEENTYFKEGDGVFHYKDNNGVYWIMAIQDASQAFDNGIGIYVANKDSEGNYSIEYKSTVEFEGIDL